MENILPILLGIGVLALFFLLMSVKLIFKKDGKFEGTCASQSPFLNPEGKTCSYCGKDPNLCENK
ncbi:hypothetical protein [Algivirga pacifica]|uniref:Membrane or secreted protein n=1 Tax=Algivirga pacifica TaxID=1162670 RepID=A0ABP9DLI4_9BACT